MLWINFSHSWSLFEMENIAAFWLYIIIMLLLFLQLGKFFFRLRAFTYDIDIGALHVKRAAKDVAKIFITHSVLYNFRCFFYTIRYQSLLLIESCLAIGDLGTFLLDLG